MPRIASALSFTSESVRAASVANLGDKLKLTYTGTPFLPLVLPLAPSIVVVPAVAVSGQAIYSAPLSPVISAFSYSEFNLAGFLTSLSFDDLAGVGGTFNPGSMAALTTLSLPELVTVGGSFNPNSMAALTTLSLPKLVTVGSAFNPSTMAALTTLSLPELATVVATFNPSSMAALTTLSTPNLARIGGTFNPSSMAALTTLSLPSMISYGSIAGGGSGSVITVPSATMANVESVTLGTIGTLKAIVGLTITLSGLKIPSANVNAILALLVSLDGTGGTTLWGSGKTLTINGGTNGAPTGQGITDKATLQARGATVTTN